MSGRALNQRHSPCGGAAPFGLVLALVLRAGLLRAAGASTCTEAQWAADPCAWPSDSACDVPTYCSSGDCMDCDPCSVLQLGWVGCSGCTAAGCYWCEASQNCMTDATGCSSTTDCSSADGTVAGQVFTDPAAIHQAWWLEAINVGPVWGQSITGTGVNIFFRDDGLDYSHPDFQSKYNSAGSSGDPLPTESGTTHGTFVASYAAAAANNGVCGVGVAYGATVSGASFAQGATNALTVGVTDNINHVHSNSWGIDACTEDPGVASVSCPFNTALSYSPCNHADCASQDWALAVDRGGTCATRIQSYCSRSGDPGSNTGVHDAACEDFWDLWVLCGHQALSNAYTGMLRAGVTDGRNGKGIVYTFAAGNEFSYGDNVNFEGWLNSIYTIAVGALDRGLKHAYYSSAGAPVFVSAPGGETGNGVMVGALASAAGMGANSQQCQNGGQGTSYACPVVSGVIALMLEANNNLHWRDVQDILARTSVKVDSADASWVTNSAGLHHSYLYGFGLVDAGAAVTRAQAWAPADTKDHAVVATPVTVNMAIPNGGAGVSCAVEVTSARAGVMESVEHVVVYVSTSGHTNRGDLELILTSPSGTSSVLAWQHNEPNDDYSNWKFMTVRNWGESAAGVWEFTVRDAKDNGVEGNLDSWILAIYGKCTTTGDNCLRIVQPEFMSSLCDDTCQYANDGACDDGGPGASYTDCTFGTDCSDCGVHFFDAASDGAMALNSVSYTCMSSSATTTVSTTTESPAAASVACPPGTSINYFWPHWVTLGGTSRIDCQWNSGNPTTCPTYPRNGGTDASPVWDTVSDGTVACAGLGDYCWYTASVVSGPSYENNYYNDLGDTILAEMNLHAADGLACNAYNSVDGGSTPLCTTDEFSCSAGYQLKSGDVAGTGAGACQRSFCDAAVFTAGCCELMPTTTATATTTATTVTAARVACPPGTSINYFWPHWITLGGTSRVDCQWNSGNPTTCPTYPRNGGTDESPVWDTVSDGTVACAGLGDYCWYTASVVSGPSYEDKYYNDLGDTIPTEMNLHVADGLACNAYSSVDGGHTPLCTTQDYFCPEGYQLKSGAVAGTGVGACQLSFCDQAVFAAGCCELTTSTATSTTTAASTTTETGTATGTTQTLTGPTTLTTVTAASTTTETGTATGTSSTATSTTTRALATETVDGAACPPGTSISYFWPYVVTLGGDNPTTRIDCQWNGGIPTTCPTYPRNGGTADYPVWATVSDGMVACARLGDYCWYTASVVSGPSHDGSYYNTQGDTIPTEMNLRAADGRKCNPHQTVDGGSTPFCTTHEYSCPSGYELKSGEVAGRVFGACQMRFCEASAFIAGCCQPAGDTTRAGTGTTWTTSSATGGDNGGAGYTGYPDGIDIEAGWPYRYTTDSLDVGYTFKMRHHEGECVAIPLATAIRYKAVRCDLRDIP